MLEAISARLEIITKALQRTSEIVEANTHQVASLSESITRLENLMEWGFDRIETSFGRLEVLTQQQLELSRQQHQTMERGFSSLESLMRQQHETAQMQGRHIDRLMAITETLIQQRVA
jgi:hypothetical protein